MCFHFSTSTTTKKTYLSPLKKKHLRKDLRRSVLIFKQLFILAIWINPTYIIISLEQLDFSSYLILLWDLRFNFFIWLGFVLGLFCLFCFVFVFEDMTVLPNIIISCIYIIIKVLFLVNYCNYLEKSKKEKTLRLFFFFSIQWY